MGIVQNILDRIYKREINKSDFASYFKRIDFDNFFIGVIGIPKSESTDCEDYKISGIC